MTLRTLTDRSASDSFEERAFVTIYLPALSAFATLRNHAKRLTAPVTTVTVISVGQKTRLIDGFRSLSCRLKTPARIGWGSATNAIYGAQMSAWTKTAGSVCFQKLRTDDFDLSRRSSVQADPPKTSPAEAGSV